MVQRKRPTNLYPWNLREQQHLNLVLQNDLPLLNDAQLLGGVRLVQLGLPLALDNLALQINVPLLGDAQLLSGVRLVQLGPPPALNDLLVLNDLPVLNDLLVPNEPASSREDAPDQSQFIGGSHRSTRTTRLMTVTSLRA